ncbi:MAG TPA: homoserine dehydrogenase [Dehalococcoidia bacterium]|nr:homoserine dehydrogenase [Dehalococcoidia bacterium]
MAPRNGAREGAIGIGLMGLGTVGGGVAEILTERAEVYARRVGRPLRLRAVLVRDGTKPRRTSIDRGLISTDPRRILDDDAIQIVIEAMGGEHPALEYMTEAIERGKHVVTASKEVMAKHGPRLLALAHEHGVEILYEASVGGGIPLIAPLKRDLLANELTNVRAIINGTTNYILTRMSNEGSDFAVALAAAQNLGYAEPDPTADVEGIDAAYKLAILASLAFRSEVHPDQVYREGITRLTARDFRYAQELGYAIKLLAIGRRSDGGLEARVHPAFVPADAPLAKVDGVFNAVQLEGDLLGAVLFQGRGAGSMPTTSAVVADVIDLARTLAQGGAEPAPHVRDLPCLVRGMEAVRTRYYIRIQVADQAGVLAQITRILGEGYGISIASVIQKETDEAAQTAELVIMTHEAVEASMQKALGELRQLAVVAAIGNVIRVEDHAHGQQ